MLSEKQDFHVTYPDQVTPISAMTMKATQDYQMTIRDRIRATIIWISAKLPGAHTPFQIIYGADDKKAEED